MLHEQGKYSAGVHTMPLEGLHSCTIYQYVSKLGTGAHLICTGMPNSHTRSDLSSLLLTKRRFSSMNVTVFTAPRW